MSRSASWWDWERMGIADSSTDSAVVRARCTFFENRKAGITVPSMPQALSEIVQGKFHLCRR